MDLASDVEIDNKENESKDRERKSIFIKVKFKNFYKQLYSVLAWQGTLINETLGKRIEFQRVDFSFSSYALDFNQLKYNDDISKYFDYIKNNRIETLYNHIKNFSLLQKKFDRDFKNLDIRSDDKSFKFMIREIEGIIERCYKEIFFEARYNIVFDQQIENEGEGSFIELDEGDVEKIDEGDVEKSNLELEKIDWNIPEQSRVMSMSPIIDPNKGIPSYELKIGDYICISPFTDEGKIIKQEFYGGIKQMIKDPNVGFRILVDLGENNFGDLEMFENIKVKASKNEDNKKNVIGPNNDKDNHDNDDVEYKGEFEDENESDLNFENFIKNEEIEKNHGFYYFILITIIILLVLYYFAF